MRAGSARHSPTKSRSTFAWVPGRGPRRRPRAAGTVIGRLRTVRRGEAGEQRRPGRRAQLSGVAARPGVRRDAAQQLDDGGGGHGHRAVRAVDPARADRDRGDHELVEAEMVDAGAHPDDVGDRVEGADLVEVHLVGRRAVHGRLGACRAARRRHARGQRTGVREVGGRRAGCGRRVQVRCVAESATCTWQRVAAKPFRETASDGQRRPAPVRRRSTARETTSNGTPASSSAPSSMSPLAPEDASTQPITSRPREGVRCARPGPRRRRRRSRCRC